MTYVTMNQLKKVLILFVICLTGFLGQIQAQAQAQAQVQAQALGSLFKASVQSNALRIDRGMDLKDALKLLENHFNVAFFYRTDTIEDDQTILNNYVIQPNTSIEKALAQLLRGHGLEYKYINPKTYGIYTTEEAPLIEEKEAIAFQETITGRVTDAGSGEALPGVNIVVKGTSTGTSSDLDGMFELTIPSLQDTLLFTYIGYLEQEVPVQGRDEIFVELEQEIIAGDEVVVVGYGQQQRRDITSSISTVDASDFENEPVTNVGQTLQGRVSGVQVMQNSGNPGSDFMIRVRGVGSINDRDTQPLFVIDGSTVVDPNDINPDQIESIQVLKSASATAIYGAKGANGVVIIETKTGQAGNTLFDLDYYTGVSYARREYATLRNESLTTAGYEPQYDNPNAFGEGTDWQDVIYRPANQHNLNLSVSGGNERSTFSVGAGYENEEGVARTTFFERWSVRAKSQHEITNYLDVGLNALFSRSEFSGINPYGFTGTIFGRSGHGQAPTIPPKQPDGSWSETFFGSNVAASLAREENSGNGSTRPSFTGGSWIELTPWDFLAFRSQFNVSTGSQLTTDFNPTWFISTRQQNEVSSLTYSENMWTRWNLENTLTYEGTFFERHNLTALAGFTVEKNKWEDFFASANNLPANSDQFEGLRYLGLADSGQNVGGSGTQFNMVSYLGRINYDYNEKYLVTFNYRVDGSSKFGQNNQYGYFPSFSLGWRLSDEPFMQDLEFVDNLLIRGGWGQIGNQQTLPNFAYLATVSQGLDYSFLNNVVRGQAQTGGANPNLKWEAIEELNFGISYTGFNGRLNVDVDYYDKRTTDMLLRVPVLELSGIEDPAFGNAGEVQNKGVEFSVGYQTNALGGDLFYSIRANVSYNQNEVLALAEGLAEIPGGRVGFIGDNFTTRAIVGQPLGVFRGHVFDGIFQTQQEIDNHATQATAEPGDIRFKDLNNDGVIDQDDRKFIGNPWPDYVVGLNAQANYKNFDLAIGFTGTIGNDIFNASKWAQLGANWFNWHEDALGRWTGPGTSNYVPRMHEDDPNNNLRFSDWYVEDGSYLRLSNVQLGYTIPQNHARNIRVFVTGRNLLTITGYSGTDPELGTSDEGVDGSILFVGIDTGHLAVPRTFTAGINIGF